MEGDREKTADPTDVELPGTGWTAWPAAESLGRTSLLVVVILLLAGLCGLIGGDFLWGLTGAALMVLGLNRWFLPTTFEVDDERIDVGYPLRRRQVPWKDVRRLVIDPGGGWLSTSRGGRRSSSGLDLYWGRRAVENQATLRSFARRAVKAGIELDLTDSHSEASGSEDTEVTG
ncbi:MAG: hypothetical protein CMJ23_05180 [Phycisphaerae bacterium]|nr:hypothetical protein [Phycisphaerae bacterium]